MDYLIVKFTGLQASPFGKGFVGFVLAAVTLYVTQYFVAGYSISWMAAIIGALIYGVVDYLVGMYYEIETKRFKNYVSEHIIYGWQEQPQQVSFEYVEKEDNNTMPFEESYDDAPF